MIAESFEKMHKNHLVGMGIAPLQFLPGQCAESLGLCGKERFSISIPEQIAPQEQLTVLVGYRRLLHVCMGPFSSVSNKCGRIIYYSLFFGLFLFFLNETQSTHDFH